MITPVLRDKRFLLTTGTIGGVLAMTAAGVVVNEQILTFLGLTLTAFMGQSQWGQTKRMTAAPSKPAADDSK